MSLALTVNYNILTNVVLFSNNTSSLDTYLYTVLTTMAVISYYAAGMLERKKITLSFAKLFASQGSQKGSSSRLTQTPAGRPFPGTGSHRESIFRLPASPQNSNKQQCYGLKQKRPWPKYKSRFGQVQGKGSLINSFRFCKY